MELLRPQGHTLHWRSDGGADAPGVLLSHGLFCDHRIFDALKDQLLAQGYRVVSWDLPGHGRSDGRPELDLSHLAEDLWAVADVAELEQPVLLGQGLGGQATLMASLERPGATKGLALWGVDPRSEQGLLPLRDRMFVDAARGVSLRPFLTTLKGLWSHGPTEERDQLAVQLLERSVLSLQMKAVRSCIEAQRTRPDLTEQLPELQLPAWVAWGAGDRLVSPQAGQVLLEKLPRVQGGPVEASGHLIHLDQPGRIRQDLLRWLADIDH